MHTKPLQITQDGQKQLQKELTALEHRQREIIKLLKSNSGGGDVLDRADHESLALEHISLKRRIMHAENTLKRARVVEYQVNELGAGLGSRVRLMIDGQDREYILVSALESNPTKGRLSIESPLGQALFGEKANDEFQVNLPVGARQLRIASIS